jgi:glutathione S-transferase
MIGTCFRKLHESSCSSALSGPCSWESRRTKQRSLALPMSNSALRELNRLLGNQPFMAGDQLSLADLMVAPQIYYLAATPEGRMILKDTAAWLGRMNARASMKATLPPEALREAA